LRFGRFAADSALFPLIVKDLPRHILSWEVGPHSGRNETPKEWVPAEVPGAVQLDWARAHGWPEYWKGDHFKDYEWMEDVHWTYRTRLDIGGVADAERLYFVCRGIDYRFQIFLGDVLLVDQEGMFTPVEIDLTGRAKAGDVLIVTVYPAPKSSPGPAHRQQANRCCKPAVSYGWDFHPRLIPLGIWDETYLEIRPAVRLIDAEVSNCVADDLSQATATLSLKWTEGMKETGGRVRWSLRDPDGAACFEEEIEIGGDKRLQTVVSQTLKAPRLWWPNGEGEPALYESTVELLDACGAVTQYIRRRVGFRRVRLVMNEGAWERFEPFPKSRSAPPITLEINGRRLFCKGSNWVGPSIFPGTITAETYRPLLELFREANLNLIRCWGGAIVNKESFFDQCDAMGIMVWQEFPLACNEYPDDADYLRVLDQESRSIIRRLKPHPCVVLWCGGNELFNAWSGMTDQALPLRLLNRNCYDLDPQRPFLPTSPLMGMGHGHYHIRDDVTGEEAIALFQQANATAYPEFGCAGPAPADVLRSFLPPEEWFPPRVGTGWESHHAYGVWRRESHLYPEIIEYYCGPSETLEELVDKGQYLQGECYKGLFEEVRRQKPAASMALNWCFNEPWPTAANCSLVSWPARPKPALAAVTAACRPVLASARIRKFLWNEGDWFDPEIWMLSDSPEAVRGGIVEVSISGGGEEIPLLNWSFPGCAPNTNQKGPRIQYCLPGWETDRLILRLRVPGQPEFGSEYPLVYVKRASAPAECATAPRITNS